MGYRAKRLIDVMRGLRAARALAERERWPRGRLERHQGERLEAIVRHAAAHSPFYRARLAGLPDRGPIELRALPTLDKATMMERFDELTCDRRLRREALLEHLESLDGDALYLGQHRVMTSSGSSGRKGLFVYDREAWVGILAQFFRYTAMAGVRPRLPRLRVAAIGGGSATHMTRRVAATAAVGVHRTLSLPATMPLDRLVDELNAFQPQFLNAYPSMAMLLAEEQRAARLRIAPERMSTSSELRTPEMTERIAAAFGVHPVDLYGTTEGLWGASCEHGSLHLFEDLCIVENVDEDGAPVPDGERGSRLLVTNLFNRVQPLIRFELSDVVTIDPEPCPCGRPLRRVLALDGRADDILYLDGARGPVAVHPLQFGAVTADRDVCEFQMVQEGERLRLRVVLREGAAVAEASERLQARATERLIAVGVQEPQVEVEPCDRLERPAGKLQMVVADPRRSGASHATNAATCVSASSAVSPP
jgi:phenylacetate-coenzyme A ligase PaaK-like adenylate-forming protein